ncbi:cupin domain-containing protein [Peptoniphilus raoultii]|uniref:cupin domain-containing protein n=1 Tax=Peptoniphilus raoultii TaxID=1776387 RepID=UPI0008D9E59A|nr:cupin domain-containing protein [Peptoniphilus raoultii]
MKNLDEGKIIDIKSFLDYKEGEITNLELANNDGLKLIMMAFDKETGLKPHAAPGDTLLLALEGKAKILVGDNEFIISEGEEIVLIMGIIHNVTSQGKFKMLLILEKEN